MAAITGPNNQSTDCKRCILLLRTIPQLRERERETNHNSQSDKKETAAGDLGVCWPPPLSAGNARVRLSIAADKGGCRWNKMQTGCAGYASLELNSESLDVLSLTPYVSKYSNLV